MDSEEESVVPGDVSPKKLVYSMIFDYVFHEAWQEFSNEFTVDSDTNREFISALTQKVGRYCNNYETMMKSQLLHLMVLLCDSKSSLLETGDDRTFLERAFGCLEEIDREELEDLSREIKLQAVVSCCRDGDWGLAQEVYQRLWPNGHSDSNSEKKILQAILHGKHGARILQTCNTYDMFLRNTQEALQSVVDTFSIPLLHSAVVRLTQRESSSQSSCDDEQEDNEEEEFGTADELTQHAGSQESGTGDARTAKNDNNNNQVEMLRSLELEPRRTGSRAAKDVNSIDNGQVGNIEEEEDDVEFSVLEVQGRELRSRTIPGYVKTQMILSNSKKVTEEAAKSDAPAEEENMETGNYGQDDSLVMDLAAVAEDSNSGAGIEEAGQVNSGNAGGGEGSLTPGTGEKQTLVRRGRSLRRAKSKNSSKPNSKEIEEDVHDGGTAEDGNTGAVKSCGTPPESGTLARAKTDHARLRQSTLDWKKKDGRRKVSDKDEGQTPENVGAEPMAEEDRNGEVDNSRLSKFAERIDGTNDLSEGGIASRLTIPKTLLRNAFSKMGYDRCFRDAVRRDLTTMRKSLIESKAKRRRSSNPPPEDGSDVPSATSTPKGKTKGSPTAFITPSKTTPAKTTPAKTTPSKVTPTKDSFAVPNRTPLREVAGPSGLNSGHLPGNYQRRNRLRELERACDEDDGERVTFSSDEDSSSGRDSDVESIISRATLKSPKLRRSLEPSRNALRRPWTGDEVRMLIKGVRKFGVGRWAEMITYYDFQNRTNVNLKDKWRQLQRKFGTSSPSKMSL